jgi:hypothetical protein
MMMMMMIWCVCIPLRISAFFRTFAAATCLNSPIVAGCVPVVLSSLQRNNYPFQPYIPWPDLVPVIHFDRNYCPKFAQKLLEFVRNVDELERIQAQLSRFRRLVAYGIGNPFGRNDSVPFDATDMIVRWVLSTMAPIDAAAK